MRNQKFSIIVVDEEDTQTSIKELKKVVPCEMK